MVNEWQVPDLEIDEDWQPDLFAFVGKPDSQAYLAVADHYRRRGIPIIGICPDNHRQDLPPNCDFYFLAHDFPSIVKPPPDKYHYLPSGYDEVLFTRSEIPWSERRYDVAMVGYPYSQREILHSLFDRTELECFFGIGQLYEEYRDIYQDTRISLSWSVGFDLPQRLFETIACGCFFVTDRIPDVDHYPEMKDYYDEVLSVDEIVDKVREYVNHPPPGFNADLLAAKHGWTSRAEELLFVLKDKGIL